MATSSAPEQSVSAIPAAIPITVIGGYLGAGKTTLLNSILRRADGRRFGVIVNDFGALGIDAGLLAEASSDNGVINLANGCVCCTLGGDLHEALATLADVAPRIDQIVVEASGVADPAATAAWGTIAPFAPGGTIVLAAADTIRTQSRDRYVGAEVVRQVVGADVVVLTKIDRCDDEHISAVADWLQAQTGAPVIRSANGDVPMSILEPASRVDVERSSDARAANRSDVDHGAALRATYVTWSFESSARCASDRIDSFLDELPDGILRLKGTVADTQSPVDPADTTDVQTALLLNVVGRRIDRARIGCDDPQTRLEAIGISGVLDERELERLAVKYLRLE